MELVCSQKDALNSMSVTELMRTMKWILKKSKDGIICNNIHYDEKDALNILGYYIYKNELYKRLGLNHD